jgi:hypothetical protein
VLEVLEETELKVLEEAEKQSNKKDREILEYFFSAYPQRLNNSSNWGFFKF